MQLMLIDIDMLVVLYIFSTQRTLLMWTDTFDKRKEDFRSDGNEYKLTFDISWNLWTMKNFYCDWSWFIRFYFCITTVFVVHSSVCMIFYFFYKQIQKSSITILFDVQIFNYCLRKLIYSVKIVHFNYKIIVIDTKNCADKLWGANCWLL
jgi:hypothetical protein